jgi:biopolymer transport protein ExbB
MIQFIKLAAASNEVVTSWFDLIMKGGIIMIPILLLSIVSIYIFVERYVYLKKATARDNKLLDSILKEMSDGHIDKALVHARNNPSSMGRILESGISKIGKPTQEVESFIETSTNLEITKMERDTGYLGIIAGIAPMLGFIGTISGVIKIFYSISLADNISIGIIAGGLYQKMICSGAGLIVGVVAYSAYHFLQMKIDRYSITVQEDLIRFLKAL